MEQATQSAEGYQKQFEYGLHGVNKKRFFKNNQHHTQQCLLHGSDFERQQKMYDVYGQPIKPVDETRLQDEHYWSEYRRNYELSLKRKMEEDRKRLRQGGENII